MNPAPPKSAPGIQAMNACFRNRLDLEHLTLAFLLMFAATSSLGISLMQVAYGLSLAAWIGVILWTRARKGWCRPPLWRPMLVFIVANMVVVAFSLDRSHSLNAARQLGLMGLVLVVGNSVGNPRHVAALIVTWFASAMLVSFHSIGQYYYGMERVMGFFGGPMTLARVLVLVTAVAIPLSVYGRGPVRQVAVGGLLLTGTAVFLTFSRSAWLALGVALLFLGVVKKNWILLGGMSMMVCVALSLAAFCPQTETGSLIRSALEPMNPSSARFHKSNLQRYWMYKSALKIFCDYPITGVGQRNFNKVYSAYVPEELRDPRILRDDGRVYTGFAHAHSLYLNLLATQGMLGLAAFLWLMAAAVRLTWHNYRRHDDALLGTISLGILTAMVAFLALGMIDENSRDSESVMQLWFLMGMAMAIHRLPTGPSRPAPLSAQPNPGAAHSRPGNA